MRDLNNVIMFIVLNALVGCIHSII